MPLSCVLIEHRDGLVLLDTVTDPAIMSGTDYIQQSIRRFLLPWIFRFCLNEADRIDQFLARVGVAATDIRKAAISLLHFDLADDGAMILLPTPGRKAGCMSMLIRQKGWDPILLVGNLTCGTALLERDVAPVTGDSETLLASFAKVRRLKQRLTGLAILASHDVGAQDALSQAKRNTSN